MSDAHIEAHRATLREDHWLPKCLHCVPKLATGVESCCNPYGCSRQSVKITRETREFWKSVAYSSFPRRGKIPVIGQFLHSHHSSIQDQAREAGHQAEEKLTQHQERKERQDPEKQRSVKNRSRLGLYTGYFHGAVRSST